MLHTFVPTRKEYFEQFLKSVQCVDEKNTQTQIHRVYQNDDNKEFYIDYFPNHDIFLIQTNDSAILPKGCLDVTDNPLFNPTAILNNSLKSVRPTLEGTDGVGKTTYTIELLKNGIVCQDRNIDVISKHMFFDIPMEKRAQVYYDTFKNHSHPVIFIVNTDKTELEKRIGKRSTVEGMGEYDDEAYRYGLLYIDTFIYMKEHKCLPDCFHMVDATGKSIDEISNTIKQISLSY